jgi:hypothetical protein
MSPTDAGAVLRVGVTGHRKLGDDPRVAWFVHVECVRILDHLLDLARYRNAGVVAYSALAIGADTLFAQAALGLGLPLVGILPFEEYPADFEGVDRKQFETLLGLCSEVQRLPLKRRSNRAYEQGGLRMVDQVEHVVAVWNGLPAAGRGGTGDIVKYAEKKQRCVWRIDPGAATCRSAR